ncbi:MAG TPA: aspartate 1-decarboxylase [Thermodesulfobacteriota bacterium]|jgi:aspartate 1-decarboxylase|nr:aspartate 1-decarboxylase [Thermodesulfobacteriota bacterium]
MQRVLLKSKIHRATVTEANVDYEGSITVDKNLMEAADLVPYEQVHIFNVTNGHRFYTYAIEGRRGSGVICINGAAAHLARKGDTLIIASFASYRENEIGKHDPKLVYVDEKNRITKIKPEQKRLRVAKG